MWGSPRTLRATALLAAASLALHELRYLISGASAGHEHGYLPVADLLAGLLLAGAIAQLVRVVARARRTGDAEQGATGPVRLWLASATVVLVVHVGQETVEAVIGGGSAFAALGAVFGAWATVPLALVLGALVALGLRGASALVAAAARRARRAGGPAPRVRRPAAPPVRAARPILATHLAGRAPPVATPA